MREQLSQTLATALRQADAQARQLNQEFVGTEHLLLGMLATAESVAHRAIKATASPGTLRQAVLQSLPRGAEAPLVTGRLPLSPKAQRAISTAMAAAQAEGEPSVTTRLLLRALLEDEQLSVCQALRRSGADLEQLMLQLSQKPAEVEK